jgi:hypothetical protein
MKLSPQMMKECSLGEVSDKMDVCVEKHLILLDHSSSYEMAEQRLFLILLKLGQA